MSNTYNYKVKTLNITNQPVNNTVKRFTVEITGSSDSTTTSGIYELSLEPINTSSYIDYDNLTEGLLVGWFTGSFIEHTAAIAEIDNILEIKSQNVITGSGLPWN